MFSFLNLSTSRKHYSEPKRKKRKEKKMSIEKMKLKRKA